jgi:phenylpyruvate tautomerase PptA (4-oxalocrotonate tautomerase family)
MPICIIEAPSGLSQNLKKELIEKVLDAMVIAYKMVDDRVYINEYKTENYGDTPHEMSDLNWRVQSAPARVVCSISAPPGLDMDSKRIMFRSLTEAIAGTFEITDQRDVLAFLNEHQLENVASNGYIQMENPAFASPATS